MTTNEQDKFIKQIIASHNVLMTALRKVSQVSEVTVMECEVTKEDFVRSSR
jgi:hypothetical protein